MGRAARRLARLPGLLAGSAFSAGVVLAGWLVPGQPSLGWLAAALAMPALLAGALRGWLPAAVVGAAALAGIARAELPATTLEPPAGAVRAWGQVALVQGTVAGDVRDQPSGVRFQLLPSSVVGSRGAEATGYRIEVFASDRALSGQEPAPGDRVRLRGRLLPPRDLPGAGRRARLARDGVSTEVEAASIQVEPATGPEPLRVALGLRRWYRRQIEALVPQPHAAVLMGVVLGVRSGIPADLRRDLTRTGLVHLLVLSGLKVAVFARLAMLALRPLGRRAVWPAAALIALYALAGGATPAAVRAAAMGGLVLLAGARGRAAHVWTSLALVSAVMLAIAPGLVFDIGFQLSFAGTAAIVALVPWLEPPLRFLPGVLREPLVVTVAATVGTVPIMLAGFQQVTPLAPLTNALVIPVLPAMIAGGLSIPLFSGLAGPALAAGSVTSPASLLALPLTALVQWLIAVARAAASWPLMSLNWNGSALAVAMVYYPALLPALLATRPGPRRRRVGLLLLAVLLPVTAAAGELGWQALRPEAIRVLAPPAGPGVLLSGRDRAWLIDGGPGGSELDGELSRLLPAWRRRPDLLVITQPDPAHSGAALKMEKAQTTVLVTAAPRDERYLPLVGRLQADGYQVIEPEAGGSIRVLGRAVTWLPLSGTARILLVEDRGPAAPALCYLSGVPDPAEPPGPKLFTASCGLLVLPAAWPEAWAVAAWRSGGSGPMIAAGAERPRWRGLPPALVRSAASEGGIEIGG